MKLSTYKVKPRLDQMIEQLELIRREGRGHFKVEVLGLGEANEISVNDETKIVYIEEGDEIDDSRDQTR